ncbi:hypothetical protein QM012_000022 [Aureobasidium pullulans]|uniref:F-box domain-containing protein n=1 Tax=Aureobasidium pullulans TaxID=5580 RepID=A0ABR0TUG6_AURPU
MAAISRDVLYHVSAYLDHRDLCNFSLVNQQCYYFSKKHLYRDIVIKFSSPKTLNLAVEAWDRILQRTHSFQHVQHVKILPSDGDFQPTLREFTDCGDDPAQTWRYCLVHNDDSTPVCQDSEWHALSCLIKNLPTLHQLTWACTEQIPASILRYINHSRPHLQLYMRSFRLRCLCRPAAEPIVFDPYEIELATSPCLYSLTKAYDYRGNPHADHNQDAIIDMLAGAAPNLREINIFLRPETNYSWNLQALQGLRHIYQPNSLPASSPPCLGALKSLKLVADDPSSVIQQWNLKTDFQCLESLEVYDSLYDDALLWLASRRLSALKHVAFSIDFEESDTDTPEAANMFILSLESLKSLKLRGPFELRMLLPTFDHCGHRLRRLLLASPEIQPRAESFASVDFILALREKCPRLEELALSVMRSQGDISEVAIYRALGTLRCTGKIYLAVYCPQPFPMSFETNDQFDEFCSSGQTIDGETQAGLDRALINHAFDEKLARSIFHTISKSKSAFSYPLERLSLRVQKADSYRALRDLFTYIGRSWTCIRNERDDRPHDCYISEYDPKDKLDREYIETWNSYSDKMEDSIISQALYRVWPAARAGDWKQEWHSFPLAGSTLHSNILAPPA